MPGPLYFAYVDQGTAFDPDVHNVMDEDVFVATIEHAEGDFPALEIELKNPRVGILADGRKQWVYLSIDRNWPDGEPNLIPLFYGRVLAVPQNLQEESLTLSFLAKPFDLIDQKEAVAATKRVQPYWDPIWFDDETRDDPDNILESRPELWHFDRVTHVVTTSNIVNGEDGTLSYSDDEVFYDSMQISYGETPLTNVSMTATVDWDMVATGVFNISSRFNFDGFGCIYTYTGQGLVDNWPKAGASLGNGWSVEYGAALRVDGQGNNIYYTNSGEFPSTVDYPFSYRVPGSNGPLVAYPHTYDHALKLFVPLYLKDWRTTGHDPIARILAVMRWKIIPVLQVRYDTSRKYSETISLNLSADCQSILTDEGGNDTVDLTMSSSLVGTPVDPAGALPIGDVRRRTYFSSDRGQQSIEYLIAILRSRLLARARTVDLTFAVPFWRAIDDAISCRHNGAFTDPRLPGGTVGGKVKHYRIGISGDTGEAGCDVTIGCCIGQGGTVEAAAGDPTYVDAGVLDLGIQAYENQFIMPIAGEVIYQSINGLPANDDGLDLMTMTKDSCIKSLLKENTWQAQEFAMSIDEYGNQSFGTDKEPSEIFKRLDPIPTRFTLVMKPVTGGPFLTPFSVELSELKIPKQIDLEAPSA